MMNHSSLNSSLSDSNRKRSAEGLARQRRTTVPRANGWIEVDGIPMRDFASNDYLGLSSHSRVAQAATAVLDEAGCGSGSSALICGRTRWHEELEVALADFEQTEACLLFPSGYAANLGTLKALIAPEDTVFCERLNHASLVDGCRLSGARLRVFRGAQLDVLERELRKAPAAGRRWIVTDSYFSMDGTLAPLSDICGLAERYGADVVIDEAHATGVFGEHGRGVAELTGTEDRIAVRIGTLSKAIGALGGFVAGPQVLIDGLWNSARTQMFSTALPPAICAAATAAIDVIRSEPQLRKTLRGLEGVLRAELEQYGFESIAGSTGPIVPVIVGDNDETLQAGRLMERQQFLVGAVRPPTVPSGTSRLRISLSARVNESDVRALSVAVARAMGEIQMSKAALE